MGVVIGVMEAEVSKDEGLERLEEIFGRIIVLLLRDFPITPGVIRAQPILILRFLAPAGLRFGISTRNAESAGQRLNQIHLLLKWLFLINVLKHLSLGLIIHVRETLVDLGFIKELTLLLK